MRKPGAAVLAVIRWTFAFAALCLSVNAPAYAAWNKPWKNEDRALVIDAYEFNPIDWPALTRDKRIAGFINKASDGLPPAWSCRNLSDDEEKLCKNRWWKYSVTRELYHTRRAIAKQLGLKWGAYHLGRPGNPREQADHFLDFAEPADDELIALDIEDNSPDWMSLADAEIFADQIKVRTGRYPVLYTNGSTANHIDKNREAYPLLSRLPLWYARYRDDITGLFPEETWPDYALWQFSSMHNCSERSCPYRVEGAETDIDVNVSPLTVAELRRAWPFPDLVRDLPDGSGTLVADTPKTPAMLNAYGPAENVTNTRDPLAMLTEVARQEHAEQARQPILSSLARAPRVDPDMPGDAEAAGPLDSMLLAFEKFSRKMQRAWQVLLEDEEELVPMRGAYRHPLPMPEPEADTQQETVIAARSKIAERLRAAQIGSSAEKPGTLEPHAFAADDAQRGGRLTGSALALEAMAEQASRVENAFALTQ